MTMMGENGTSEHSRINGGNVATDFVKLKEFIYTESGIKITGCKKTMLEARLKRG